MTRPIRPMAFYLGNRRFFWLFSAVCCASVIMLACQKNHAGTSDQNSAAQVPVSKPVQPAPFDKGSNISVEECEAVITQYQDPANPAHPPKSGLACVLSDAGSLELLILAPTPETKVSKPTTFGYTYHGAQKTVPVRGVVSKQDDPTPEMSEAQSSPTCCGTTAQNAASTTSGTAGLNIMFNGVAVCISNQHVLRDFVHEAKPVRIGTAQNASLLGYQPLAANGGNYWDLAMAQYDPGVVPLARMCTCPGGYPILFAQSGTVYAGQTCHKDGAASNCTEKATLIGEFTDTLKINGVAYQMDAQLLFSQITKERDSGAVMIRSDNQVLGLHMANVTLDGKLRSVANPLYRAPLHWEGTSPTGLLQFAPIDPQALPALFDNASLLPP